MAKTSGIFSLKGKLGDTVHSSNDGVDYSKQMPKGPINQSDDTKKTATDFGVASKTASVIFKALEPFVRKYSDGKTISRLTKRLLNVLKTLPKKQIGGKKVADGQVSLIAGFEFSRKKSLGSLLYQLPRLIIVENGMVLNFAPSTVDRSIKLKKGATHVVIQSTVAVIDLSLKERPHIIKARDLTIDLNKDSYKGKKINISHPFEGLQLVLLAVGVHYLDGDYRLHNGKFNAATIAQAILLRDGVEVAFVRSEEEKAKYMEQEDEGLEWEEVAP